MSDASKLRRSFKQTRSRIASFLKSSQNEAEETHLSPAMEQPRIVNIEVRHASKEVSEQVRAWFSGEVREFILDGERSVHIPHPVREGYRLKIKGAGLNGGPVQFGAFRRTGPKAPSFDFEGRMMEDVASGHDNAVQGGASFQQAAIEYRVSTILDNLGYKVVPCLGYGKIQDQYGRSSWFSVFEWDVNWHEKTLLSHMSLDAWIDTNLEVGKLMLELACKHNLIGYLWYVLEPDGSYRIKDVHPFIVADPINMSHVSWAMQLFFSLHIRSNGVKVHSENSGLQGIPDDLHILPFRAVYPEATIADHEPLRLSLVAPYMRETPADFSPDKLYSLLEANPITRRLLELCPEQFVRF